MRTLTFDAIYGESGRELNIYVEGQLAMVSVNAGIQDVIADLNKPKFKVNGERAIASMLLKEINEEFELTKDEQDTFKEQIEEKLREGEI